MVDPEFIYIYIYIHIGNQIRQNPHPQQIPQTSMFAVYGHMAGSGTWKTFLWIFQDFMFGISKKSKTLNMSTISTIHFQKFTFCAGFRVDLITYNQYIQVDTIFYMLHFGLPGTCLYLSPQNTPFWRRRSQRQKGVCFQICLKTFS